MGAVVGVAVSVPMTWQFGVPLGWSVAAAIHVGWSWVTIWPMGADSTASHAVREDPGRAVTDLILVTAAIASLGAVALLLRSGGAGSRDIQAGLSVASVALAWAVVHTVFAERYARLYYTGPDGGVDFNERPQYSDFAYLAFTVGMTFQVSDTEVRSKEIRATVLRHALLSYLLGVVVIAATINLVASLSR
ncbi:protein of unknown function DUF1345 [Intrasporangium calvum DSM 43043]|uniref:DUF1345 domain-containing protein n=1 Tax=Intrasporangium calvum (strain ATCC 23552 / DSM 43043 / JCM 3097 / NBRC 12989 / NCIMB 10167 / NRRL B-3866 / 7 KIP) TaxID=710696 RepID=E6S7Q6_INTC7|nr:protein of unknown function DUF1345 [Intrasporangium calvum DSM 43043]